MATSKYFNHLTNTREQDFFQDLVVENIRLSGMDVHYLPRTHTVDDILRESVNAQFNSFKKIEVYFHDVQGYGGEGDLMSKFGFVQKDTVSLSMAKKAWRDLQVPDRLDRPVEGDLIWIPMSKSLFEITNVEHEDPFWQLGRYNVFKLSCSLFTRGYEKFNTGETVIDTTGNIANANEIDLAINEAIESKAATLLDFTEANPFGDL